MNNTYIIWDLECDHIKPQHANPIQFAALAIDPIKLKLIPDSKINIKIRPPDINTKDYLDFHSDTINFHAKNRNVQPEKLVEEWKGYTEEKIAWKTVIQYLQMWNPSNNYYKRPIAVGANLEGYDFPIVEKVNKRNGFTKELFFRRDTVDIQKVCGWFLLDKRGGPQNLKVGTLGEYFGLEADYHDAMEDVIVCAKIFVRFKSWCRRLAEKQNFKGSMKGAEL